MMANLVYRPKKTSSPIAQPATLGVKFAQNRVILDDWYLFGGTRRTRTLYRLKHPIVYEKRGLRNLYRRIKRIFIKEPLPIMCRIRKNKESMLEQHTMKEEGKIGPEFINRRVIGVTRWKKISS